MSKIIASKAMFDDVMNSTKVKVFDLDETLVSTEELYVEAYIRALSKSGMEFDKCIWNSIDNNLNYFEIIRRYREISNLSFDIDDLLNECKKFSREMLLDPEVRLKENSEITEIVKKYAGINTIFLLTHNDAYYAELTLKKLNIYKYFDEVISVYESTHINPKLPELERIFNQAKIEKKKVAYFEDRQKYLTIAKNLGIITIGVIGNYSFPSNADWLIDVRY